MKLFLQLTIQPWQETAYEKPLLGYASSLSTDVVGTEMDSQSEQAIADLVIKLCDQSSHVFIFIQASDGHPMGVILKVLHHLYRTEKKIANVVLSAKHERVEKLSRFLNERFTIESDSTKVKETIRNFAQA